MINKLKMYGIKCDGCGKQFIDESTGWMGFTEKDQISDAAQDCGWKYKDNKDFCPDCHAYDDDGELIILTEKPGQPE